MEKGKYIVIEGHDGTGKSTQIKKLAEYLRDELNTDSFVAEEPAGTPIADEIRMLIKNGDLERSPETNLLLFTAARHEIWQRASQELKLGKWVLSSRNYISTLAYQGSGEGLSPELILDLTENFTDHNYMNPDKTIILSMLDSKKRQDRIGQRGELTNPDTFESKPNDFQEKVNSAYLNIADQNNYDTIDAGGTVEGVFRDIKNSLKDLLPE